MAISERLKHARGRAGLTLDQVAEQAQIGASSLCDFERGKRDPKVSQLVALSKVYHRSVEFFLSEAPVPMEKVLWREKPEPGTAGMVETQFLQLCEQFHNLEVWCGERKKWYLPIAEGEARQFHYREAEDLAYQVASKLKLGDRPGQSLLWVLEEVCGIKVFHLAFEPTGTAACTKGEFGSAILLNSDNVRWRRNFDLAHELFHLLTWDLFRTETNGDSCVPSEREEKYATCFASHLLMPTEVTRLAILEVLDGGRTSFDGLFDVARQFDVSMEALLWRMGSLFKERDEGVTRADIENCRTVVRLYEEREDQTPPKRPGRFRALAIRALRHALISTGRCAEYLGISRKAAQRFLEQEGAEDEEIAVAPA